MLNQSREIISSCNKVLGQLRPQKKDEDCFTQALETVTFFDDDVEIEQLKPEPDRDHHPVTTTAEIQPQPEEHIISNMAEIYSVPSHNLDETISEINQSLQKLSLEQERLTALLSQAKQRQEILADGQKIMAQMICGEDYNSTLLDFDVKLRRSGKIHALIKDFLLDGQQQLENIPLENRSQALIDFCQDERLSKALYGFKCQICSFTFEQSSGGFYAETFYFRALSDDGVGNLDDIIVLCPNHQKMLKHAKVSIRYSRKEEFCFEINGRQHIIKRIPLQQ